MLQRLQEQKRVIVFASSDFTLPVNFTVLQWELIDILIGTLSIFDQATLAVSSSTVTSVRDSPHSEQCHFLTSKAIGKWIGNCDSKTQSLLDAMNKRCRHIEEDEICSVATLLDPRLKGRVFLSPSALNAAKDGLVELANQHEGPASINEEAMKRMLARNGLSSTEAEARLSTQHSNSELVAHAHVVFCTAWDPEFTQYQVEKAWNQLQNFLH